MQQYSYVLFFVFLLLFSCDDETDPIEENETSFITAMDLSYQPMLEAAGVQYKDQEGNPIELLPFLSEQGVELVRIRLWHSPTGNHSTLEEVVAYCQRIKAAGMEVLLDIHYSDTWADPAHQTIPQAWEGLGMAVLEDSVYQYTKRVLEALDEVNSTPQMVQIGNETNSGFLWDQGKTWIGNDGNWSNYAALVRAAIRAVEEQEAIQQTEIQTMLHIAGVLNTHNFFEQVRLQGIDYDIIGLSYYHHFHTKDLVALEQQLQHLATTLQKPIFIAETNYPWTLAWNDWTHNWVGTEEQLLNGFSATPQGQKAYLEKLAEILQSLPSQQGLGFCWWAPDLVAFDGPESTEGSFMENLTTFDFEHKALSVMEVFNDH